MAKDKNQEVAPQSSPKRFSFIVTGAAGFIGCNLVQALNARGCDDILLVDSLGCDERWKNLRPLRFADYLEAKDFLPLVKNGQIKADYVFHMGACSSTTETDAAFLMENNYRFTRTLAESVLESGGRMLTASSAATYGAGECGYRDDTSRLNELRPLNMYGYSKHITDLWAQRCGLYDRGLLTALKFFNVYGPYEDHKGDMRSMVWKSFWQIKETGKVGLFKSQRAEYPHGGQKRDFIYVGDAVKVMLWCYDHPEIGGLFNCGTGQARTWLDLARAVFKAMERPENIEFIDMPAHLSAKYQYFTEADMTKLKDAGYNEPFTSLEDGVAEYVKYLKKL